MLLCGEPPFDQRKTTPILEQVTKGEYRMPEDLQQSLTPESRDLVSQLLQVDVKKRIPLDKIATHPWVVGDKKSSLVRSGALDEETIRLTGLTITPAEMPSSSASSTSSSPSSSAPPSPKEEEGGKGKRTLIVTPAKDKKSAYVDSITPLAPGRFLPDKPVGGKNVDKSKDKDKDKAPESTSSSTSSTTTTTT